MAAVRLLERCDVCGGRLTCPDKPTWVMTVCMLSPLSIPAVFIGGVLVTR